MSWVPGPKTAEEGLCPPLVPNLLKLLPLSSHPNTMFLARQIPCFFFFLAFFFLFFFLDAVWRFASSEHRRPFFTKVFVECSLAHRNSFSKKPFFGGYFLVDLMCCNVMLPHYHTTYKLSFRINLDLLLSVCFVYQATISCRLHNLPLKFSFAHIRIM
jgi:hypothetical protein